VDGVFLKSMKIGIHSGKYGFSDRWIAYCESKSIPFKIVNCYNSNIIEQLSDCSALMWHFQQGNPRDIIFAKQLIYALQTKGIKIFPDFNTMWHFDDKVGQKYLLEAIQAPFVPTWVFYDKSNAISWSKTAKYPLVLKLRGGAGSENVKLVKDRQQARHLISKAFRSGFSQYNALGNLKERIRKYKLGRTTLIVVLKGVLRLINPPLSAKYKGKDRGYIYFQKFIPGNYYDIRVIVVDNKSFAIKRMVRENDFRASGSGHIHYSKDNFDEQLIQLSVSLAKKLMSQCVAFDFVFENEKPLVLEISYGFVKEGYDKCPGYWDEDLKWHEGPFNPYGWMVESIIRSINKKEKQ